MLRKQSWHFGRLWQHDTDNVIDYLKQIYMEDNVYYDVNSTSESVEREAKIVLEVSTIS